MCKGYLDKERNVSRYLLDVNDRLNEMKGSKEDVLEVRGGAAWHHCMHVHTYDVRSYEISYSTFTTLCQHLFQDIIILLYRHTHYTCDYRMYMKRVPYKDE